MADVINNTINAVLFHNQAANGSSVPVPIGGLSVIGLQVTGLNGAAIAVRTKGYDPNSAHAYQTVSVVNRQTNAAVTSIVADGTYLLPATGDDVLMLTVSGYVSGNIEVTMKGSADPSALTLADIAASVTVSENIGQFGGSNVVTGTGAGGAGVPRVTLSNDSSLAANQSVNLAQVGGAAVALGQALAAASLPVTLTALEEGQLGALTEAAPGTDTASSGLNGRLQRVAQRLTSLIAVLPAALGQAAMAASLPVVIASNQSAVPVTPAATENHLGEVGGHSAVPSANFTRPANTTAYASGQLVANSTTAASVVPLSWTVARVAAGSGLIRRVRLKKSGTTTTLATFRLHLYSLDPSLSSGIANGDGAAWSTNHSGYLGSFDLDMTAASGRAFRDSAGIIGTPAVGSEINFALASGQTIYGLLEARAAYVPGNAEVFTVDVEVIQN